MYKYNVGNSLLVTIEHNLSSELRIYHKLGMSWWCDAFAKIKQRNSSQQPKPDCGTQ